jgi:hypothetical protein
MPIAQFSGYKLIRDLWPQKSIYEALFDGSPCLGLIRKDTTFGERIRYIDVGSGLPQGVGVDYGTAKKNKTASLADEFQVQKRSFYGTFSIEGLLWRTYEYTGNKAIIVDPMGRESKNLMRQMKNDLSTYLHGNGVGVLGVIAAGSDVTTTTITLSAGADARRIMRNMYIEAEQTGQSGGAVLNGYGVVAKIGGTDAAPTVTLTVPWNVAMPGVAVGYSLYRQGTYNAAPILGMDAWNPDWGLSGSPLATPGTFLNVNRDNWAAVLGGYVLDGRKMTPRQRALRASRIVADAGGKGDTYAMSTRAWEALANELQSQNILRMSKVPAAPIGKLSIGVTYDSIELIGAGGKMDVVADPWMPDSVERCFQRDTLVLGSLGELIHWDKGASPDSPMLEDAADSREVRAVGDIAFYNECPAFQCRVKTA